MRLGLFGGTFDPPHIGHLILADEALTQLGLQRILWILTPDPPHKQGHVITPVDFRLKMLQAALAEKPGFEICEVDIRRPPPHYAVDTLQILHQRFPGAELVYIIGGDSLVELPTWHDPAGVVEACDQIGVIRRPGWEIDLEALEGILPGLTVKVSFIQAPLLEISSSMLRQRIFEQGSYRYYLPAGVQAVIESAGLYRKPV